MSVCATLNQYKMPLRNRRIYLIRITQKEYCHITLIYTLRFFFLFFKKRVPFACVCVCVCVHLSVSLCVAVCDVAKGTAHVSICVTPIRISLPGKICVARWKSLTGKETITFTANGDVGIVYVCVCMHY